MKEFKFKLAKHVFPKNVVQALHDLSQIREWHEEDAKEIKKLLKKKSIYKVTIQELVDVHKITHG